MKFLNHIFKRHAPVALSILFILAFAVMIKVFASPPPGGYSSGTQLDPDCLPGATDCIVASSISTLSQVLTAGNDAGATGITNLGDVQINGDKKLYFSGATFWESQVKFKDYGLGNSSLYLSSATPFTREFIEMFTITPSINYRVESLLSADFVDINHTQTSYTISGLPATFPGLQYDIDYSANFTDRSLVDKGYADATYAPYKKYVALISQSGSTPTDAPTEDAILENTLGGSVTWSYLGTGTYKAELTSVLIANKTFAFLQTFATGGGSSVDLNLGPPDFIIIQTFDAAGSPADNQLLKSPIEIRVYP